MSIVQARPDHFCYIMHTLPRTAYLIVCHSLQIFGEIVFFTVDKKSKSKSLKHTASLDSTLLRRDDVCLNLWSLTLDLAAMYVCIFIYIYTIYVFVLDLVLVVVVVVVFY